MARVYLFLHAGAFNSRDASIGDGVHSYYSILPRVSGGHLFCANIATRHERTRGSQPAN
ncbi:hypothetical protein BDZ89DRAFT_1071571 [Hymenopellis radicata]|nr:hypothetical protein BDZ89DRAFT_1071571 [Hymenopellis radicata]